MSQISFRKTPLFRLSGKLTRAKASDDLTADGFSDNLAADEDNIPDERFVVWWYGPLFKNIRAETVPKVVIFLRALADDFSLGPIIRRQTALTHLGILRIGSVWHKHESNATIAYETRDFDVSFDKDAWHSFSPRLDNHTANPISIRDYVLPYSPDSNYLLQFDLGNSRTLLIPSMEFFIRCYGRSAEIKRVLATYPWQQVRERFFAPTDTEVEPGTWLVKLRERVHNDDAVFLAHLLHDPYAALAAKRIYSQIESSLEKRGDFAFLNVVPWFTGVAKLRVAGIQLSDQTTFLGLRILGMSYPKIPVIYLEREGFERIAIGESPNGSEPSDGTLDALSGLDNTVVIPRLVVASNSIDLTDNAEPDYDSPSLSIAEEEFVVLGQQPIVVPIRQKGATRQIRRPSVRVKEDRITEWSTGEHYGSGKGVGHAHVHARAVMESQGILRDMWNACRYIAQIHSEVINSVSWFTFDDAFRSDDEPKLVGFEPFKEHEAVEASVRRWPFYDISQGILRGVLLIKIDVAGKVIFILEIQRRLVSRKTEDGNERERAEESYKGLVFVLNDAQLSNLNNFRTWLRKWLANVRDKRGILHQLISDFPGDAHTFVHSSASDEKVLREATVKNALRKVGISI